MAGLGPDDIDLIELHDCFATAEILHYGNLGICKQEDAGRMIDEGEVALGGRIPVNVSGGLLSKGHPLGATGIANIYEVSTHLRNEAGARQVEGAKIGGLFRWRGPSMPPMFGSTIPKARRGGMAVGILALSFACFFYR